MEKVRKDYVDGQNLKYQDLVYGALKGMINTLDPHSEFMEPEKYKELQNDTQGAFGGLGIVISMKDNFITVVAPMEDSPGFKAGIMSGDRIIKIDGKSTEKTEPAGRRQAASRRARHRSQDLHPSPLLRPSEGLHAHPRHHQPGHGQGHQWQEGVPAGREQDRLYPPGAVWREDQRRAGGGP